MGMPAATDKYWLPADLEQFPEGDGCKYECIDGELFVTPAPRVPHVAALNRLCQIIELSGATNRVIIATADVRLESTSVVEPDLFVLREPITGKTRLDVPDCVVLVAEVLSPSTANWDRGRKRALYQRTGVPEYWIVDLDARLIERWTPGDERPEILRERIAWTDPIRGTELTIDLERYFADVWGDDAPSA
jgi:Uma2 family endonuclease